MCPTLPRPVARPSAPEPAAGRMAAGRVVRLVVAGLVAGAAAAGLAACAGSVPGVSRTAHITGTGSRLVVRAAAARPTDHAVVRTLEVAGRHRSYLLLRPARTRPGLPLLVVLHGRGLTPAETVADTGFGALASAGRAVVALPAGVARSWNAGGGCCGRAGILRPDDTAFIARVVADVVRRDRVDASRVYLAGYSNGGKLAFRVVCDHPGLFDGLATYGSVPVTGCAHPRPLPVMIAAGTADRVLPYHGMRAARPVPLMSVPAAVNLWRARDGCAAAPPATRAVGPADITEWSGCRDGTRIAAVVYPGQPHAWPRSTRTPAAAAGSLMWAFLTDADHPRAARNG
jgi:polyhydroxybutyrate depolymerase